MPAQLAASAAAVIATATLGLSYSPASLLSQLGVRVVRVWLRDAWGVYVPHRQKVVLASGLSAVQERCVLAHEVEHILAGDTGCAVGPLAIRQERYADREAARKLVAISDLAPVAQWAPDLHTAAAELQVTERMLRVRLHDLDGEGWPWPQGGSRIGG
jgi:Zn-dependent peptidase ImmA (M78 family)